MLPRLPPEFYEKAGQIQDAIALERAFRVLNRLFPEGSSNAMQATKDMLEAVAAGLRSEAER